MLASGFDPDTLRRNDRRRQRGEYARLPNRAKWIWRCTARRREGIALVRIGSILVVAALMQPMHLIAIAR
jgi:hypothetical protein